MHSSFSSQLIIKKKKLTKLKQSKTKTKKEIITKFVSKI